MHHQVDPVAENTAFHAAISAWARNYRLNRQKAASLVLDLHGQSEFLRWVSGYCASRDSATGIARVFEHASSAAPLASVTPWIRDLSEPVS
jgi:hypothetical protein